MISTMCPCFPCMWPCLGRISFSSSDFKAFSPNQSHGYCSEKASTPSCKPSFDFETRKQAIGWNQSCAQQGLRDPLGQEGIELCSDPAGDLPCGTGPSRASGVHVPSQATWHSDTSPA